MDRSKILERLECNIKLKFLYIPNALSSMSVLSCDGPLIIDSNLHCDMFNIVCCQRQTDIASTENVVQYFKNQKKPAAWWVGFKSDPVELEHMLCSLKLRSEETELSMYASLKDFIYEQMPLLEFEIKPVDGIAGLNDFIWVISQLVADHESDIKTYFTQGAHLILNKYSRLKCFVGYVNAKPVSTATIFLAENVAGIFDIITLPNMRGQGIATAMTRAAMQLGKDYGYQLATLTATNDAKYVYEKIGFQSLSEMRVYSI